MLSPRTGSILNFIVRQYITRAVPVPSQSVANETNLKVSPATIRNEMVRLEEEGYIIRPHTSAGSVPSDKGYRYYVESLEDAALSADDQLMVSHLFHQVEADIEQWLTLAAKLLAHLVKNVAIVTLPKETASRFKYLELVNLREHLVLMVLVLYGARVKQQLVNFDEPVTQAKLTILANKLNIAYSGLNRRQISEKAMKLSEMERQVTDHALKIMQAEDEEKQEETYFDGVHFMLDQPEFAQSRQVLDLMELVEHRRLLKAIGAQAPQERRVQVIIGKENKSEVFHNYSVVISDYGLPDEVTGKVCVIGPTRLPYAQAIPMVDYLSSILDQLVARLYGNKEPSN